MWLLGNLNLLLSKFDRDMVDMWLLVRELWLGSLGSLDIRVLSVYMVLVGIAQGQDLDLDLNVGRQPLVDHIHRQAFGLVYKNHNHNQLVHDKRYLRCH